MSAKNFRVAIVQYRASGEIAENTEKACAFIREAAERQADMVLFPECFLTTYEFPEVCQEIPPLEELRKEPSFQTWRNAALGEEDAHLARIASLAEELRIGVTITAFSKGKNFPQNSAWVIGRDGSKLLKYSKVHTCDFSLERYLESGDHFPVCTFDGIKLGVMICYDREYPESARELMLAGAEIILVPNDCGSMAPRLRELSVRAMENMVGIAMANPPGKNMGRSCAYDPMVWGEDGEGIDNEKLAADERFEGIVCADFDMEAIREYRAQEDLGKYRKTGAYRRL